MISGGLTIVGYVVAESFYHPESGGAAALGHNTLAVAISLFLIGFFTMLNRRKALTQVLALLSLENGLFLAAIRSRMACHSSSRSGCSSICWWRR